MPGWVASKPRFLWLPLRLLCPGAGSNTTSRVLRTRQPFGLTRRFGVTLWPVRLASWLTAQARRPLGHTRIPCSPCTAELRDLPSFDPGRSAPHRPGGSRPFGFPLRTCPPEPPGGLTYETTLARSSAFRDSTFSGRGHKLYPRAVSPHTRDGEVESGSYSPQSVHILWGLLGVLSVPVPNPQRANRRLSKRIPRSHDA